MKTKKTPYRNYNDVKMYFNDLNNQNYHFQNSNDICTPIECVKEMVDSIPSSFWKNKDLKILDPCSGNGNFHAYINLKTDVENLYFNEINPLRVENLIKYFGSGINLTQIDFLQYEENQKYDLIVANPPYAKFNGDKRVSKNHNLSRDFINKALKICKDDGYILFIVPNNWMSFSDRNTLPIELSKYQFIHIDIHGAKKWFPKVGSSFTWFLLKKTINKKEFTVSNSYVLSDVQKVKLMPNMKFIPLYLRNEVISIIKKVIINDGEKYSINTNSYLHHYTQREHISKHECNTYRYRLIHTPSQTVWSDKPHKYQDGYKVFISLTNQYFTFIDNCGMTQSVAYVLCDSVQEAEQIKNELDNPVYKFVNNVTRYGNFNNIRVMQNFNKLSTIKLTKKEEEVINKFNEVYYGKKRKK